MTKQERVKAWNEFAAKVAEYIEANAAERVASSFENREVSDFITAIQANVKCFGTYLQDKQDCYAIAHLAQLVFDNLYPKPFCTRQAVEYLKQGKSVRPAGNPDLVVLDICYGSALSKLIDVNYATFNNRPVLPVKDHFLIVWGNDVVLARELPTHPEWLLASETEVKQAVERATKGDGK